ncbi:hypothetical protein DPMN_108030 [Dreissena polymorpha]|uniref:Uncharacterized protein n=1 Tax=Dreissena polymorpha TaxID=45954 RepID=A0A9D4K7S9_DREPO|nr:hypothetical protein DPMN_108030 [Dreissena polymorpha]
MTAALVGSHEHQPRQIVQVCTPKSAGRRSQSKPSDDKLDGKFKRMYFPSHV